MSSASPTKLIDELERLHAAHSTRLRTMGGKSQTQDASDVVHDGFVKTQTAGRRQAIRDPLRAVLASERLRRAMDIIGRMPDPRREAFLLHRTQELSYAQVAGRMGISPKEVEKHISLAMAQLYREIDE